MQYIYPFSGAILNTGTVTRLKPIGDLYECVDFPFSECYDCLPSDAQINYYIDGDVIFYNLPWTADSLTVYNFDGTIIGDFSQWIFGNQLIITVDDLPEGTTCFYFSVMFRDVRYCFDFGYKKIDSAGTECGIGTITIESKYKRSDCHNNIYNDDPAYSNKRRFLAEVEFISSIETATLVDDIRINSKVYNQYQIRILQPLRQDSRLLEELVEVIMRGADLTITIDNRFPVDVIHCTDFTEAITRTYDTTREWYPAFVVKQLQCDSALNCN